MLPVSRLLQPGLQNEDTYNTCPSRGPGGEPKPSEHSSMYGLHREAANLVTDQRVRNECFYFCKILLDFTVSSQ